MRADFDIFARAAKTTGDIVVNPTDEHPVKVK